jgi:hypothetical protein
MVHLSNTPFLRRPGRWPNDGRKRLPESDGEGCYPLADAYQLYAVGLTFFQEKLVEVKFEQYVEGFGSLLECPYCGGNHLRHGKVEIFERAEDQDAGLHFSVVDSTYAIDNDLTKNPSSRRHGLSIHFTCEHCDATPVLNLAQHKGNTWVDFKS